LAVVFEVVDRHPGQVELVFRHFPVVAEFDKDSLAGQAAEAAGRQGLFWEMARLLVERHAEWSILPPEGFREWLYEESASLGLDPSEFRSDIDGGRYAAFLAEAFHLASTAGVPGLPTILLNGVPLRLAPTEINLESAVRLDLLASRQFVEEPPFALDPAAGYTVTFETTAGEIVVQLFPASAPRAVNSLVFLAGQGWFDRTTFYRVEPGFLVEAGDPSETGFGDPGYHLPDEIDASLRFDQPGMLALSSAGPGTGGSRFVITLRPVPDWDGTRTIFGRVVEGLDLLVALPSRDPALHLLEPADAVIRRVRIEVTR
jgi:peptidyl-prolyl cis-trans isomerase B (cyclophilin B)